MPAPNPQQIFEPAMFGDHPARVAAHPLHFISDCVTALVELALARRTFDTISMHELQARNAAATTSGRAPDQALAGDLALVERVAATIPRIAPIIPWRADCLVQALAAQRWLTRRGIATVIQIGVEGGNIAKFSAHAWSQYGSQVVTGEEIARYAVLLGHESDSDPTTDSP